jgi:hypothetical protein
MAQEIVNRLLAACKVAADGTILARSGNVASVAHVGGSGVYVMTLTEGIGPAEVAFDTASDTAAGDVMVAPTTPTQFTITTRVSDDTIDDAAWNVCLHRLSSSNGT